MVFHPSTLRIKGFASAVVAEYHGAKVLLSVAHSFREGDLVGIGMEAYQGRPNVMFFRPEYFNVGKLRKSACIRRVLFKISGKKVDAMSTLFKRDEQYDLIYVILPHGIVLRHNVVDSPLYNQPKHCIPLNFPCAPTDKNTFETWGLAFRDFGNMAIEFEEVHIDGMRRVGKKGRYHLFATGDRTNTKGCSGAPIFDNKGNLVSLFVKKSGRRLWGIDLNVMRPILDVALGRIDEEKTD